MVQAIARRCVWDAAILLMGVLTFRHRFADLTNRDPKDPGIWYQSVSGQEWVAQTNVVDLVEEIVSMDLHHFSNYALAF